MDAVFHVTNLQRTFIFEGQMKYIIRGRINGKFYPDVNVVYVVTDDQRIAGYVRIVKKEQITYEEFMKRFNRLTFLEACKSFGMLFINARRMIRKWKCEKFWLLTIGDAVQYAPPKDKMNVFDKAMVVL